MNNKSPYCKSYISGKPNLILLFIFISLLPNLHSLDLSYGILDESPYIDKNARNYIFLHLKEEIPECFPEDFPRDDGFLYGEIPIGNERLIIARNITNGEDEIYVYNSFNDSTQHIIAEEITSIKDPLLVNCYISLLQKNTHFKNSALKLFGLSAKTMLFSSADFRYGFLEIDSNEYFFGLANNTFDYSDLENTVLYIDLNNNGYVSDKDSIDVHGNSTKETLHAIDSFIIDHQAYKVDSISVNGYTVEISKFDSESKFAAGFMMPSFSYYDSETGLYDAYKNTGDVTLIFYWSPGCGGAQMHIPIMSKLYENYDYIDGFRFISFVPEFVTDQDIKELDIRFPFYDGNPKLMDVFGPSFPKIVIIDSDGIIKTFMESNFTTLSDPKDIKNDENYKKIDRYLEALLEK